VRFAYVSILLVEGKQTHILLKPKTLSTQEKRERATRHCPWEIMLLWEVHMLSYLVHSYTCDPLLFYFRQTSNAQFLPDYSTSVFPPILADGR
jgi:hypothetical protein